ncbi:sister chromatid cohesion 1 protein 2 isoform X1 [Cucurbita pepo subsp. pepo]|uniref:sister chromatid cohesion 1 protein 2 isoform X1 n=2 Tax=Cucurbita pepo subsp. pepo TaxID=3664 RepID=UPI000C9D2855|nr:sister chromatid cohesion 1 protein 2 isoform X1 [Cucurbita pepo subsp. pepo]
MFHSHCTLSRKGPSGAIWVAAYFFKKLKKSLVIETDIPSSVDKILQDEMNAVTYRVMAYLLLGIARIYSKKVEYLYVDCNKVLTEINEFVVTTKNSARKEKQTPYYAITLPKRFELDSFDLGIIEDLTGSNMVCHEEITLKDSMWKNDITLSVDENHGEEFTPLHSICYSDDTLFKEVFSPHLKDSEMQASSLHHDIVSENFQVSAFSDENYEIEVFGIENTHIKAIEQFNEDHRSDEEEMKKEKMLQYEHVVPEASTEMVLTDRFSHEETVIVKEVSITEHLKLSEEDNQSVGIRSENELEFMNGGDNISILERSMEKLRDNSATLVDSMDINMSWSAQNEPTKLIGTDSEGDTLNFLEMQSPEMEDHDGTRNSLQLSISLDGMFDSKFPDFTGTKTPEFTTISTPANKERPRTSRKRKCIVDDPIVLSNEKFKRSIYDASNLVSKRSKCPRSGLAVWKASQISTLSFGFSVPLMSCVSPELKSLLSKTLVNISESAELVKSHENLDDPSSPAFDMLVKMDSPVTVSKTGEHSNEPEISGSPTTYRSEQTTISVDRASVSEASVLEQLSTSEPQTSDRLEQIAIAPGTPVRCSTSARLFGSPDSPKVPNSKAQLRFCEEDALEPGSPARTRMVCGCLLQNFRNQRVQTVGEAANLRQLLSRKTRKESAKVFYEILVLKTKNCVDVRQDCAYGDILVWKLGNWDTQASFDVE